MDVSILVVAQAGRERNASQFEADELVFEARTQLNHVEVVVEAWNPKHKTFRIYLNGERQTAIVNYTKAIGEAVLLLQ
jgi:hypothetical protein